MTDLDLGSRLAQVKCKHCGGSGQDVPLLGDDKPSVCAVCDGSGCWLQGVRVTTRKFETDSCPYCNHTGRQFRITGYREGDIDEGMLAVGEHDGADCSHCTPGENTFTASTKLEDWLAAIRLLSVGKRIDLAKYLIYQYPLGAYEAWRFMAWWLSVENPLAALQAALWEVRPCQA